jgi:hypothetical protein
MAHKITVDNLGCWLDCSRGRYIGEAVQAIAQSYGWTGETLNVDEEFYDEAIDEAEDYMNGLCPSGLWFGSSDGGDWGLWSLEENETDGTGWAGTFAHADGLSHDD